MYVLYHQKETAMPTPLYGLILVLIVLFEIPLCFGTIQTFSKGILTLEQLQQAIFGTFCIGMLFGILFALLLGKLLGTKILFRFPKQTR